VAYQILAPDIRVSLGARSHALAVMTKAPRAGAVKTRLIPPLTAEEAAALNICFLRDITATIQKSADTTGLSAGIAVYTPVGAEESYRGILPTEFFLIAQRGNGFGERLQFAVQDLLNIGFVSVCLINSDSPTVPASVFTEATQVLTQPNDRVVLGPSEDGGYYLIGLKKSHARLFEEIDWSTEKVLRQTIDRAQDIDLDVHLLPSWFDVDDRATLQRLSRDLLDQEYSHCAPATRTFMSNFLAGDGRQRIWPNE
jgi:rSAM/selenodomain-associated transferase 1